MEKLKKGDRIIITDIKKSGNNFCYSSGNGKRPPIDMIFPYETTVKTVSDDIYGSFGDGIYGFWGEKTTWKFAEPNYEIY